MGGGLKQQLPPPASSSRYLLPSDELVPERNTGAVGKLKVGSAKSHGIQWLQHVASILQHSGSMAPQAPCQSFLTLEPAACSRHVTEQWYNKAKPSENKWKLCKQHQSNDSFFQSQKMPHWLQVKHALSSWTWVATGCSPLHPFHRARQPQKHKHVV
jgi:hypothetical protein